eukprot:9600813-Alexandrium_andersonii.AAC.1
MIATPPKSSGAQTHDTRRPRTARAWMRMRRVISERRGEKRAQPERELQHDSRGDSGQEDQDSVWSRTRLRGPWLHCAGCTW